MITTVSYHFAFMNAARDVLVAVLIFVMASRFVWRILAPLGAIWRGDESRVPYLSRLHPQARTYVAFCLWVGSMCAGMCLMALAILVDAVSIWHRPVALAVVAIGLLFLTGPLMLLNTFAWAFNRPRFLVVPAHRDHPGWMRSTVRRFRTRAGRTGEGSVHIPCPGD